MLVSSGFNESGAPAWCPEHSKNRLLLVFGGPRDFRKATKGLVSPVLGLPEEGCCSATLKVGSEEDALAKALAFPVYESTHTFFQKQLHTAEKVDMYTYVHNIYIYIYIYIMCTCT